MKTHKSPKLNSPKGNLLQALAPLQKKIVFRMVLVALTIILTVVLVFAQTVAWQTNVVQTGGVTFSASTWDFSGEVLVEEQGYSVAPGDTGVIGLRMKNNSTSLAAASVVVSKETLHEAVRHRFYYYVETTTVRHNETVDRVYLSERKSYTYTIFPHSELLLTEAGGGHPLLKWEWTYDNLGYYVLGTKDDSGNVAIEEYLSPILYDYDPMRTTFDVSGQLETVDGEITVAEFLADWSGKDGYEGQINPSDRTLAGYYPVDVAEETGYGVWAYLCTQQEIWDGSVSDTELGRNGTALGSATVSVTGQNCHEDGVPVYNEAGLIDALSAPGLSMLTLQGDVTLTQPLQFENSDQVMIDLGGNTLTSTEETIISAMDGASVMLCNGTVTGTAAKDTAIDSKGGSVTLQNVTITDVEEGVLVSDHKTSTGIDSHINLIGCTIIADQEGVWAYGNDDASAEKTTINIEGCTIEGQNYAGIICNGSRNGVDITVSNSIVKGFYTAIYYPQKDSNLTIRNSTLEGYTGLVVKGGTVRVEDCIVTGTGNHNVPPENLSLSGWTDTGDGVYLEANYTDREARIYISGEKTKITCKDEAGGALAVRLHPVDSTLASISITGGTYCSSVSTYLKDGYLQNVNGESYVVAAE